MKSLVYIFALFFVIEGTEVPCDNEGIEDFLDQSIAHVVSQMEDPLPLPDRTAKDIMYTDGKLWGIDTLNRTGDAEVICNEDSVTIKSFLGVEEMIGRYNWKKIVHGRLRHGAVTMKAETFEVFVEVRQPREPEAKAELISLDITKLEGIDIDATGMSYLTWVLSQVIDPIANMFKDSVAEVIQKHLTEVMAERLGEVRLPID